MKCLSPSWGQPQGRTAHLELQQEMPVLRHQALQVLRQRAWKLWPSLHHGACRISWISRGQPKWLRNRPKEKPKHCSGKMFAWPKGGPVARTHGGISGQAHGGTSGQAQGGTSGPRLGTSGQGPMGGTSDQATYLPIIPPSHGPYLTLFSQRYFSMFIQSRPY